MINKNKGDAGNIAGIRNLGNQLTMENLSTSGNKFQFNSRRELLERSKLSRLPSLPKRQMFHTNPQPAQETPNFCANCNVKLTQDNHRIAANVCTKCAVIYAKIVGEIDRASDEKLKAAKLQKFGGFNR